MAFFLVNYASAKASPADIAKAQAYLKELSTVKADFVQRSQYGELSGTFYLDRPGKLRFEYNDLDDFIVADGLFIYFYDSELGEQTNAPIGHTLADFLLREDLRLTGDVAVTKVYREDGLSALNIIEASDPGAGSITLLFQEEPYRLVKWEVIDAVGLVTEIELTNFQRDIKLPASLFRYFDPKEDKQQYNE